MSFIKCYISPCFGGRSRRSPSLKLNNNLPAKRYPSEDEIARLKRNVSAIREEISTFLPYLKTSTFVPGFRISINEWPSSVGFRTSAPIVSAEEVDQLMDLLRRLRDQVSFHCDDEKTDVYDLLCDTCRAFAEISDGSDDATVHYLVFDKGLQGEMILCLPLPHDELKRQSLLCLRNTVTVRNLEITESDFVETLETILYSSESSECLKQVIPELVSGILWANPSTRLLQGCPYMQMGVRFVKSAFAPSKDVEQFFRTFLSLTQSDENDLLVFFELDILADVVRLTGGIHSHFGLSILRNIIVNGTEEQCKSALDAGAISCMCRTFAEREEIGSQVHGLILSAFSHLLASFSEAHRDAVITREAVKLIDSIVLQQVAGGFGGMIDFFKILTSEPRVSRKVFRAYPLVFWFCMFALVSYQGENPAYSQCMLSLRSNIGMRGLIINAGQFRANLTPRKYVIELSSAPREKMMKTYLNCDLSDEFYVDFAICSWAIGSDWNQVMVGKDTTLEQYVYFMQSKEKHRLFHIQTLSCLALGMTIRASKKNNSRTFIPYVVWRLMTHFLLSD